MSNMKLLQGRRVLVLDESKHMASLLAGVMAKAGAHVMEANHGLDAVGIIHEGDPDLMLLDLSRQDSDGWNVLRFISESQPYMLARTIALVAGRCDGAERQLLDGCPTVSVLQPLFLAHLVSQACCLLGGDWKRRAAA